MEKEKRERNPRQLGKATAETRGREEVPVPKRLKETRATAVDSEDDGAGEENRSEGRVSVEVFRSLAEQVAILQKAVMERLPEKEGMQGL